jgi:glutathione S-transferase
MTSPELISNHLCPYTQRAAIQLAEKGRPCGRRYIDLADKPAWLLAISPLGKVPVLTTDGHVVFETSAICEYLEERWPDTPQHPATPLARARHRAWCEFASALISEVFGFYMAPDAAALERQRDQLATRFGQLEQALHPVGPYFDGAGFHLVDAAFAPVLRLFETFDRIGDFGWWSGLTRVPAYRTALAQRPSVQQAVVADYGQRFEQYLRERGSELSRRLSGVRHPA